MVRKICIFRYIYDQLHEDRVKKMASILERTDSAYYPCFRTLYENVVSSMAEAKEISLYLSPLAKCFKAIEEVDFSETKPLMATLIHSVGLAWSRSSYYQSSSKVIIMLRQICNLLIQEARRFLDPSSIFQSDVDEALQRVQISKGENYFKIPRNSSPKPFHLYPPRYPRRVQTSVRIEQRHASDETRRSTVDL